MRDILRWVLHWLSAPHAGEAPVTPPQRTFEVAYEDRTFRAHAEDRTLVAQ